VETAVIVGIGIAAVVLIGLQFRGKMNPKDGSSSGCGCGSGSGCGGRTGAEKHCSDDRNRS
jgi:hypothetical protein